MSFQIEINKIIVTVKLENKKNIKHCYLRILKADLIQIRANKYFTIFDAKDLINRKNITSKSRRIFKKNEFISYFNFL